MQVCTFSDKLARSVNLQLKHSCSPSFAYAWHKTWWTRDKLRTMEVVQVSMTSIVCVQTEPGKFEVQAVYVSPDLLLSTPGASLVATSLGTLGNRLDSLSARTKKPTMKGESVITARGAKLTSGQLRMYGTCTPCYGHGVHRFNPSLDTDELGTRQANRHVCALSDLEAEVAPGAATVRRRAASISATPLYMRADTDGKYARYQLTTHYYYSVITTHYSLLLLTAHHSLLTTHYPLLTAPYSLPATHYSLLTTHYSLPTTHYSLLTIFRSAALAVSVTQNYVIGPHCDDAKGTYESVAFLSSCDIPASMDWHFFSAGLMHPLPRAVGQVRSMQDPVCIW